MTTYDRKYYLIREIKKAGFKLIKNEDERTIMVPHGMAKAAKNNKYLQELRTKFQYGVQLIIA